MTTNPCRLCLARPCLPACPVRAHPILERQLRYLPPDMIAEARAFHLPHLFRPPAPRWGRRALIAGAAILIAAGAAAAMGWVP